MHAGLSQKAGWKTWLCRPQRPSGRQVHAIPPQPPASGFPASTERSDLPLNGDIRATVSRDR
jgi:hypothetical protein